MTLRQRTLDPASNQRLKVLAIQEPTQYDYRGQVSRLANVLEIPRGIMGF